MRGLGRWAFNDGPTKPGKNEELDRKWDISRMGTPADKKIADAAMVAAGQEFSIWPTTPNSQKIALGGGVQDSGRKKAELIRP